MIPGLNDDGYLPLGVHSGTLDEIAARFGAQSELRAAEMDSVRWMVGLAIRAGVTRIVLNGSFVTDKIEPNDVDCVLLIGPGFPQDTAAEKELLAGLPFMEMKLVEAAEFDEFVNDVFASDRDAVPKGVVEVLW